jgi:hypothetical protein
VTAIHPSIQLWLLGSSPPSVGCINNWSFQVSRCRPSHTVLSLYTVTWGFKKWSVEKPNTKQKQTKWPNNSMDKTKPMTSISSPCGHCFNISSHLQYPPIHLLKSDLPSFRSSHAINHHSACSVKGIHSSASEPHLLGPGPSHMEVTVFAY